MLVFQTTDPEHPIQRLVERADIDPKVLVEIIAEINIYLPEDWRMTRTRNNFMIHVIADKQFALVGASYRYHSAGENRLLHIIDTGGGTKFFDKHDLPLHTGTNGSKGGRHLKAEYFSDMAPNLYYFRRGFDNFSSPLFARQYEKVRIQDDDRQTGHEYHRIHPLVRTGLDVEHFLWVRWSKKGFVDTVESVDGNYHGKDYWKIPNMGDLGARRLAEKVSTEQTSEDPDNPITKRRSKPEKYIETYHRVLKMYGVTAPSPPQPPSIPYEDEYKLLIPGSWSQHEDVLDTIRTVLPETCFNLRAEPKTKKQTDTYFDDGRFTLHSLGVSFRIREKDKDNIRLTLKKRLPYQKEYSDKGLYTRIEEEAIITKLQRQALYSGQTVNALPYRLLAYVAPSLDYGSLSDRLVVENNRTVLLVEDNKHRNVEISLDLVRYVINGVNHEYFEVEIESKGALREEVKGLAEVLEKELGGIISEQTKYERGISLLMTSRTKGLAKRETVIIDVDAGVDDALALILALKAPQLEVKAITTVAGNTEEDKVIRNVLKVLHALDLQPHQVPIIARGAREPLVKQPIVAESVHGKDGMGDTVYEAARIPIDDRPAWEVICDLAGKHPKQITLVTLGPMTNAALAVKTNLEGFRKLKRVVAMGGVFSEIGNVGADAEFNIGADPDAARIVVDFCRASCLKVPYWKDTGDAIFLPKDAIEADYQRVIDEHYPGVADKSQRKTVWDWHNLVKYEEQADVEGNAKVPLTFVGLDVTHKVVFRKATLERARNARQKNKLLKFVQDISAKYMEFYRCNEGLPGCYLHDPLTVAYVINPAFLETEEHIIRVETKGEHTTGVMFPDDRPTRNPAWRNPAEAVIRIARRVEREAFEEWFIRRLIEES